MSTAHYYQANLSGPDDKDLDSPSNEKLQCHLYDNSLCGEVDVELSLCQDYENIVDLEQGNQMKKQVDQDH